jgi:DNA mismatch repair protein MutL
MPRIRILSDRVANQIAAGEVIERPAAVVKELVENALDAGATRIEVEFAHGGQALMRVRDNGTGMSRDDAQVALERHATSKIAEAADLDRLATFGFRGEALPSMASVSRFLLQTREAGSDAGTEILVDGGRVKHVRDCGCPVGTHIEVAQLFNSVPARRKFLKTDRTESAHIVQCVRLYALASPSVAFTLIEDGRTVFRSPETPSIAGRIAEIFGRQTAEALVPIEVEEDGVRLSGLIGRPGVGRSTRHEMITFVNRRPVDSRTLNYALIESYHESLPRGRYPLAFLFLDISPAAVDANVHPTKREVRFRNEPAVRSFVIRTVLGALRDMGPPIADFRLPNADLAKPGSGEPPANPQSTIHSPRLAASLPDIPHSAIRSPQPGGPIAGIPQSPIQNPQSERPQFRGWRFLGIAHGRTILFETPSGIVMVDRRAAHERVWYERLRSQFGERAKDGQRLLLPISMELDPIASALLLEWLGFLGRCGLEVAEFGRHFFRIESIPAWMHPSDAESFLRDILGALRDGRMPHGNEVVARDALARLAAAKAVRLPPAGEAECRTLVESLFETQAPLTSPAGKPTLVELGSSELDRRFQR